MFKKWFKRNDTPDEFKLDDMKIYNLRIGDLFDYDLTTWEVVTIGQCDYDGHVECEWEVRGGSSRRTLVAVPEGGDWTYQWLQEFNLSELGLNNVQADLRSEKDPVENITIQGRDYVGYESGGGLYKKESEEKPFLYWSYEDSNDKVLNLIQWSDSEFSATMGKRVAEFQFSNILPGSGKRS